MLQPTLSLALLLPLALAWSDPTISLPACAPSSAVSVDPSFANFAFEYASLLNFVQSGPSDPTPNQYSLNLLRNVFDRTGGHPIVRIGGTSGDFVSYYPDQEEPVLPIPAAGSGQNNDNTTIGPNFWPLTKAWAELGTIWIPQVSLATNNFTQVELQAKAAVEGIGLDRILYIEPGNEADLFPSGDHKPPQWVGKLNNTSYADRFREISAIVSNATSLPDNGRSLFFAGDISYNRDHPDASGYPITIPGIFEAGVNADGIIGAASAHYYQVGGGPLRDLLNHSRTVYQMAPQKSWNDYLAQSYPNVKFIMDEVNVLTGPSNETIMAGFAGAVWRVDYFLYCASIGISSVHIESVFGSNQSVWQPFASNGLPAQTKGAYYSYLPTADFIGNKGGNTRISQLELDGVTDGTHFIAYAGYNVDILQTIALVNFNQWSKSENLGPRETTNVTLTGLEANTVTVKFFSHPDGGEGLASGMTYGGSQWTAESQGLEVPGVANDTLTLTVEDGSVYVPVPYTSVAIVFL